MELNCINPIYSNGTSPPSIDYAFYCVCTCDMPCRMNLSDKNPLTYEVRQIGIMRRIAWWRHQMETFSASLAICAGNSPVSGEFPAQKPVTQSFGVFFDLRLNKGLSEQSWGRWFETLLSPWWRHCNRMFFGRYLESAISTTTCIDWLTKQQRNKI